MYSWLVGKMIRRGYDQAVAGRPKLLLSLAADDVEFVFPGRSSFACRTTSKAEVSAWLARFASMQPDFKVHDVIVSGPPWNIRAAVRISDAIGDDYSNEGMEHLQVRWGRLRLVEVFLDTERISAWEARHPELVAS